MFFYQRICETSGFSKANTGRILAPPIVVDQHVMDGIEAANR